MVKNFGLNESCQHLHLSSDWSFQELIRILRSQEQSSKSFTSIDEEEAERELNIYDDIEQLDVFKKKNPSKNNPSIHPATGLKPYPLEKVHAIVESTRYPNNVRFVDRQDGNNDLSNVGMNLKPDFREFVKSLTLKQHIGYSIVEDGNGNKNKADVYKQVFTKRNKPMMLYFKFYLEWVVDEFQLVVVSIHKDTQKHKSMFGFEDDELLW